MNLRDTERWLLHEVKERQPWQVEKHPRRQWEGLFHRLKKRGLVDWWGDFLCLAPRGLMVLTYGDDRRFLAETREMRRRIGELARVMAEAEVTDFWKVSDPATSAMWDAAKRGMKEEYRDIDLGRVGMDKARKGKGSR